MRLILCLFIFNLASCSPSQEDALKTFDPRIPGGIIGGEASVFSVSNATLNTSVAGQITITWNNPALYLFTAYTIHVIKRACDQTSASCTVDPPVHGAPSVFEIYSGQADSYIDTNSIYEGQPYTYWIFVEKNNVFDSGTKIGASTGITTPSITLNNPSNFWHTTGIGIGSMNVVGSPFSAWTLGPGITSIADPINVKGKIARVKNGALLYVADTDNNRVVVYARSAALACESISDKLSDEYAICVSSNATEPYAPVNVIGQPSQASNKTCAQHNADATIHYSSTRFVPLDGADPVYSKCLTGPTAVWADGNNLLIADTGNNRIVVHKDLPGKIACDRNMIIGQTTVDNCAADFVIGKKDFKDMTNYSLATDGIASLNRPNDMVTKDGHLYILDAGNNRVVKVKYYANTSYFNCSSSNWKQALCRFSGLLGQASYDENKSLSSELLATNITLSGDTLSNPSFLQKYFENPTSMILTADGRLAISTFENYSGVDSGTGRIMELKSRIMLFPIAILEENPSLYCNSASFIGSGCNASGIIGQSVASKLPVWASGSGSYETGVSYGLDYVSGMVMSGNSLIAVQPSGNKLKFWPELSATVALGYPYSYNVIDPDGAVNPTNTSLALPDFVSLSSIVFDSISRRFFVMDSGDGIIHEVVNFED